MSPLDDEPMIEQETDFVRPYLVTGGRTKSKVDGLKLETLVQATNKPTSNLRFEAAKVAAQCSTATSIAEVSAHLSVPFGAAKVIVGDLIASGHLQAHRTLEGNAPDDVQLITRLISGVRRL